MSTKYVFITGGVVSSLGKGIAASSIGALLEARGGVGHLADRDEVAPGERAFQDRVDAGAVAEDADVEVLADVLLAGAPERELLEEPVESAGDDVALALGARPAADGVLHGLGLVHEEQEAGGIRPTDLRRVGHALPSDSGSGRRPARPRVARTWYRLPGRSRPSR